VTVLLLKAVDDQAASQKLANKTDSGRIEPIRG